MTMTVKRVLSMTSIFDARGQFCDLDVKVEFHNGRVCTFRASQFMNVLERQFLPALYGNVLDRAQKLRPPAPSALDLLARQR